MDEGEELPVNSLLRHPEIAREIGTLIMYCANLEIWLLEVFKIFMRRELLIADLVFGNINNIRTKFEIIFDVLEAKRGWLIAQDLLPVREKTSQAISFRNAVSHGLHGINGIGKPNLTSNFLNRDRGKPKTITLSVDLIKSHSEAIRQTSLLMRKHVGADLLIQHPGTIDGKPSIIPSSSSMPAPNIIKPHKGRQSPKRPDPPEPSQE